MSLRVVIVAEFYPRKHDPVLGIWAHHQAQAVQRLGVDVRVVVLHRPVPSKTQLASGRARDIIRPIIHPLRRVVDGIEVLYVPFITPPRSMSYGSWGTWAAPPLATTLKYIRKKFPFDLIHAHYASPGGDAVRRARPDTPLIISVHGGDVISVPKQSKAGHRAVENALRHADLVLANSSGIAELSATLGSRRTKVIHLGTDVPQSPARQNHFSDLLHLTPPDAPTKTAHGYQTKDSPVFELVTISHLIKRKRHCDVLEAMALLRNNGLSHGEQRPEIRWIVIGDGPERESLQRQARELNLAQQIEFLGQLPNEKAVAIARQCSLFVLPSIDEAFGVAYIEAMAGGIPAIGCQEEPGPEEIARFGSGMRLVPRQNPTELATEIARLADNLELCNDLGAVAKKTVAENFSWEQCGRATVQAYEEVLSSRANNHSIKSKESYSIPANP